MSADHHTPQSLVPGELVACGLTADAAERLAVQLNRYADRPPEQSWPEIFRTLLGPDLPPGVYASAHRYIFRDWPTERGPRPAWLPSEEQLRHSNVAKLLTDLKFGSYAELYEWSIRDKARFWDTMIRGYLNIRFRTPYSAVLDSQSAAHRPRWLPGATLNIADSCFQAPGDTVAVRFGGPDRMIHEWTVAELEDLTDRVAAGLAQIGLMPGDPVAIDMPMTAESVAIYLGIVRAGCVAVSIADSFAPAEIATRLRIGKAKAIFTQDVIDRGGKRLPLYAKVCEAKAPRAIVVACDGKIAEELRQGDLEWEDFLAALPHPSPLPEGEGAVGAGDSASTTSFRSIARSPHDPTNYLFSSGTTGDPKAIVWNQVTPIRAATDGFVHQDIRAGDVVCWPTNLGWMMGPWLIYASLINRATIALFQDAPTGRPFGQFVADARVTMLGVVPSLISTWKNTDCMAGLDWSAVRSLSSTGECSNAADMLWLTARAGYKPVVEYCGGTELGGGYVVGTVVQPQVPAAFSTPVVGTELVILTEDGKPTDSGEMFLVPPSIGMSLELVTENHDAVYYAGTPRGPNGETLRRHGDHVERLAGGYLCVQGRVDDTMNLGGIKVSSAEIERVIGRVADVRESAAIAVPPPGGGPSRLIMFVVLKAGAPQVAGSEWFEQLKPRLQEAIRTDLNPLFHIYEVVIVESLPRTASNKVMRRELRAQYQAGQHGPH